MIISRYFANSDQGLKKDYMEEHQEILQDQNRDDSGDEKYILQKENPPERNNFNTSSAKVETRVEFSIIIYNLHL